MVEYHRQDPDNPGLPCFSTIVSMPYMFPEKFQWMSSIGSRIGAFTAWGSETSSDSSELLFTALSICIPKSNLLQVNQSHSTQSPLSYLGSLSVGKRKLLLDKQNLIKKKEKKNHNEGKEDQSSIMLRSVEVVLSSMMFPIGL
jgi:hypothetical protein